ncbi:MAG TPA: thioesterase family protein [Acidimicrobiales bacterium]|nr:thioesterase family protein [Acidimicrobiales bacterium]
MSEEPLFVRRGPGFLPTGHTRGPWDPRHQHGGAVAALVARAVERTASTDFAVTRLTVELMRPVPLEVLVIDVAVPRPGRRVLGITVSVSAGDLETEVVRAHAVAIRRADLPTGEGDGPALLPGPEEGAEQPFAGFDDGGEPDAFHRTGMEVRSVAGGVGRPGPARAWLRLRRPVVGDEEPTGVQRAAAAADFTNGVSWVLPAGRWLFLNPDLTLHLARDPQGEWIGLDAVTVPSDQGMGLAESAIYDERGRLGRAAQSLLLRCRDT